MMLMLFNVDNTLAKTNEEIMKRVSGLSGQKYPFPLPANLFEKHPDILLGAEAFDGAANVLQQLVRTGSTIVYVTARCPWFESLTKHWLRLKGFPDGVVLCSLNKREIVRRCKPNVFVDDAPHEIESVRHLIDNIYIPAKPYNFGYSNRFETWAEFPLVEGLTVSQPKWHEI